MTTRSADECEMSRSCHSGMFSIPTSAAARTTRARPEMRSATFGLRLCGIADGPRQLTDAALLERALEPRAGAVELEGPAGEFPAECRRLCMDAVRAADAHRAPVFLHPSNDCGECTIDAAQHELARVAHLQR